MSDHAHEDHGHSDEHGHEENWGDYNARPPAPSNLPDVSAPALAFFGFALAALLASIAFYSFRTMSAPSPDHGGPAASAEHP